MNRSTPINNLAPNTFVNDQQRQIVMQAQQAINNMQLPQNTQLNQQNGQNFETQNEDDAAIQEVLNQIQASTSTPTEQHVAPQQQLSIPALPPQPTHFVQNAPDASNPPTMQYLGQYPPQPLTPQQYFDNNAFAQTSTNEQNSMLSSITAVAQDVKLATFVFVVFIVLHFVPVDRFLLRYISMDKIYYYNIVTRALLAFVAVIIFKKFLA